MAPCDWQGVVEVTTTWRVTILEPLDNIGNAADSQLGQQPTRETTYLAAGLDRRGSLETNLIGRVSTLSPVASSPMSCEEGPGDPRGTADIVESLSPPGEGGSENGLRMTPAIPQGVAESSSASPRSIGGGTSRLEGANESVDGVDGSV
jgi:hypothetical protein